MTHPEITIEGDEASGVWYMQDRVIVADFDFMLIGAALYHDRYRRTSDGWQLGTHAEVLHRCAQTFSEMEHGHTAAIEAVHPRGRTSSPAGVDPRAM